MKTIEVSKGEFDKMRSIIMAWKKEEVFPLLNEETAYPFGMWLDDLILCLQSNAYEKYHIRISCNGDIEV